MPSCPVCSAIHLLNLATERWSGNRHLDEARRVPLVGMVADPLSFVAKSSLVLAAQRDAKLLGDFGISEVTPTEVTGHFMRRSGAKALTRMGLSVARVQWFGRWGSAAVLGYIEEAAEECPDLQGQLASFEPLRADVALAVRTGIHLDSASGACELADVIVREEVKKELARSGISDSRLAALEVFAAEARAELTDASSLARELDGLVRPTAILNSVSLVLHKATRTERLDPDSAATLCGWRWARTPLGRPVLAEEVARAGPLWSPCVRCYAVGQGGGLG